MTRRNTIIAAAISTLFAGPATLATAQDISLTARPTTMNNAAYRQAAIAQESAKTVLAPPMYVSIDFPALEGGSANVTGPFVVSSWALDSSATASVGIDEITVWDIPESGVPIFLCSATLGINRPDVGRSFGNIAFNASDYVLAVSPNLLATGIYWLQVQVRSAGGHRRG